MTIKYKRKGLLTRLKVALRKVMLRHQQRHLEYTILHMEENIRHAEAYRQQCKLRVGIIKYKLEDLEYASQR